MAVAKVLKRESIGLPEAKESPETDLVDFSSMADEAQEILGYHVLKVSITEKAAKEQKLFEVRQVMAGLDIRPFTPESVEAYKAVMEWRAQPLSEHIGLWMFGTFAVVLFASMVTFVLGGVTGGLFNYFSTVPNWLWTVLQCSIVGVPVGFAGFLLSGFLAFPNKETKVSWDRYSISAYGKPIPEFALQSAIDLKKQCPEANFFIEEMVAKRVPRADPFLVMVFRGESFYLEVWNEPGFKGQREA
jgi:hypothetical protein